VALRPTLSSGLPLSGFSLPFHSAFSAAMKVNALYYFARGVPVSI
jgi:hypothetical protein